jgi:5,5'-dehydrodivanillate O-demethylase oxygenase subunit
LPKEAPVLDDKLNDRLTLVGPGTPSGELLRRHWMPVAVAAELGREPVKRVRVLGEDLALFRAADGGFGLVGARCPHRGASLGYGFPDGGGLRCPYHGWLFGSDGTCLEQPNQHPDSERLRARSAIAGYPVRELGGLLFAYLGPGEPPELPVWDLLGREEAQEAQEAQEAGASFRDIGYAVIPCNWLQIMENSFDPTHVEWLHGRYFNYQLERRGEPPTVLGGHHIKIGFDLVDYGIIKRRLREGQTEADEDWRVGHPVVFPNLLKVGGQAFSSFQIRVPMDDTHTLHFWYCWYDLPAAYADLVQQVRDIDGYYPVRLQDSAGSFLMDTIDSQDAMAWVTQGPRTSRSDEHLSSSDQGIALYRNLLKSQLDACHRGESLMNVRPSGPNGPNGGNGGNGAVIELPMEQKDLGMGGETRNPLTTYLRTQSKYSPRVQALCDLIDARLGARQAAARQAVAGRAL